MHRGPTLMWCRSMAIKGGRVPYVSCEPFYFDMQRGGIELHDRFPSALSQAAENGEIDAGPIPLIDCYRMEDRFRPLSGFCLATANKAGSVILHSTRPIQELNGARIGITEEASTAFRLLQVLLTTKHQVTPEAYVSPEEPHEAVLFIGNQGLRNRRGMPGFAHTYDLGEEWNQWTGLPFVFARWIVRKDLERQDAVLLEDTLFVGLQDWADGLFHLAEPRDRVRLHPQDLLEYTQGLRYFIGAPEQKAMDLFRKYVEELNL